MLRIAKNLKLPEEAVTQTFGILAKRGAGKTYTGSVMAEEMLKAALQVVVIDPIGVWWGLRSAADGKGPGLKIVIAGGDHADVPIEPSSGEILANLVIDQRLSVVIDLSLFRKNEQVKFMTDFAETLYRLNRSALHLIIDEADAFAPQRPMKGHERMLGAIEDIVRRGRARGIGVTMITQRPAVLNKNVLTQIEVLVALRMTAPNDQKAVDEWIKTHAEEDQRDRFMTSLPGLPIGTAWFWSPGWMDIFKKVDVRTRETLDSSSTPKVGQKVTSAKMADVDLEKLRGELAETIERKEANDPIALKRKVAELERQLQQKPAEKPVIEKVEVPVLDEQIASRHREALLVAISQGEKILEALNRYAKPTTMRPQERASIPPEVSPTNTLPPKTAPVDDGAEQPRITGGAMRMLQVLGSRYPMTFTRNQLAALSKMSPRSGTFGTYMSLLKSNGLIAQEDGIIRLTDAGLDFLGDVPLPAPQTTDEVLDMWRNNLTGGARRMFDFLVTVYPAAKSREELGLAAEISPTSGTFGTYISMLAGNGLIERKNQTIKASDALFIGGESAPRKDK